MESNEKDVREELEFKKDEDKSSAAPNLEIGLKQFSPVRRILQKSRNGKTAIKNTNILLNSLISPSLYVSKGCRQH